MLPFGHAAGGYLAGTLSAWLHQSRPEEIRKLQLAGLAGGLLPDLDLPGRYALSKVLPLPADIRHHTWVTHTFPFYLVPGGLLTLWARRRKKERLARYAATVTAGVCVHLAQDTCGTGDGMQLFFPFSRHMSGFRLLHVHGREWQRRYVRDPIFLVELAFVGLALLVRLRSRR
ncbi:MAG: metal-dependent hydrolase [Chloroflexi bacterium]|nr:metal-dependent hydrolase [Chloroflexota bacterium]MCI0646609.1 metal-dependent hydrolase [Chloroflexota bacterium]